MTKDGTEERLQRLPDSYFRQPSPARVWNYWSGGKDYYQIDREVGDVVVELYPGILDMAKTSREFLIRAVRHLAGELGIRQFLDLGAGLPAEENTHQVAQAISPGSRVVYVDNDPIVLAHARALLTSAPEEGISTFLDTDYRDTDVVMAGARKTLDFDKPIAVMFMGVFGYLPDFAEMRSIISRTVQAAPSGSYLVFWDGTDTSEAARLSHQRQAALGHPYTLRTVEQIHDCFEGLELIDPGVVQLPLWRHGPIDLAKVPQVDAYGGVARKSSSGG